MSKKIVIDKEVFEQKIKGWIERRTYVRSSDVLELLKDYSTELSTDEGIDERAEKKYPDAIVTINLAKKMRYIEGATEQSLIEQMKAKEWINISDKKPDYYKVVLCQDVEGNICACWRACSDDLEDMYTINKSDNLLENVVKWRTI